MKYLITLLILFSSVSAFCQAVSRTELRASNAVLRAEIATRASTNDFRTSTNIMQNEINSLLSTVTSGFSGVYGELDLTTPTNEFRISTNNLWQSVNSAGSRLTSIETKTNSFGLRLNSIETQTNSLGVRVTALEGGGGSQTPIAQDVNYAGFSATNMGDIAATGTVSVAGAGVLQLNIQTNVTSGDVTNFIGNFDGGNEVVIIVPDGGVNFVHFTNGAAAIGKHITFVLRNYQATAQPVWFAGLNTNCAHGSWTTNRALIPSAKQAIFTVMAYDNTQSNINHALSVSN